MKIYGLHPQVVSYPRQMEILQRASVQSVLPYQVQKINSAENPYRLLDTNNAYLNAQQVNFGYESILKTLFKQGSMPSVNYGLYGNKIDSSNVSLEHLKAKSSGGQNNLSNYALAHIKANMRRDNAPLPCFLNNEMLEDYLSQFNFEISGVFSGHKYQNMIRRTCRNLGVGDELKPLNKVVGEQRFMLSDVKRLNIDYGNMKDIIANIDDIDINMLSKSTLRSLRNKGYLK